MDFVEICNVCARKAIIKTAKRIINSDKMCLSYSDLNFGVTFFGTQCMSRGRLLSHTTRKDSQLILLVLFSSVCCLSLCLCFCLFVCCFVYMDLCVLSQINK